MNKCLSNEDFDSFKTFIFLIYIALNEKTIAIQTRMWYNANINLLSGQGQ